MQEGHLPVLVEEVMSMLSPAPGSLQIDATVGGGGHTERILEATTPDGRLLGLDADGAAIARVAGRLRPGSGIGSSSARRTSASCGRSPRTPGSAPSTGCCSTSACRASSSPTRERGLRVPDRRPARHALRHGARRARGGAPRDARRRPSSRRSSSVTARSRRRSRIARAIVAERTTEPITTAEELAALIERVAPGNPRVRRRIHPATRVFQALRIAVNEELDALQDGLAAAVDLLRPGGRLVVLSYHSLEDRIVKRFLAAERRGCVCPPELPVCVCGRNPRLRS